MPNQDRFSNLYDGTYINAPDLHILQPSKRIGLREYNNGVLVHNWYEERNPVRITALIMQEKPYFLRVFSWNNVVF
jgi:hypothetical protein